MVLFKNSPRTRSPAPPVARSPRSLVRRFARNTRGRDFIVGDVHGALSLVLDAMAEVRFDPTVDRLFSTGDLIDRGPDSAKCVELVRNAVRGNHEDMLLDLYSEGEPHPAVVEIMSRHNGFGWWRDVQLEQRQAILEAVRELPLVIEIETERGLVGILHAEVPLGMTWQEFTAKIETGDAETMKSCLWGRERVELGFRDGVPGIERVFVGHTIHPDGVGQYGNVYVVDSGAVGGLKGAEKGHLTLADLCTRTQALVRPLGRKALIDLRTDVPPVPTPFGLYAKAKAALSGMGS